MKQTSSVTCLAVTLVVMVCTCSALPPDFFRAGRGFPLPIHKKASDMETDLVEAACSYCGSINPYLGEECRRDAGQRREVCTIALVNELSVMADTKGWRNGAMDQ